MSKNEQDNHRLRQIREYLNIGAAIDDPNFEAEIILASSTKLDDMSLPKRTQTGDSFMADGRMDSTMN